MVWLCSCRRLLVAAWRCHTWHNALPTLWSLWITHGGLASLALVPTSLLGDAFLGITRCPHCGPMVDYTQWFGFAGPCCDLTLCLHFCLFVFVFCAALRRCLTVTALKLRLSTSSSVRSAVCSVILDVGRLRVASCFSPCQCLNLFFFIVYCPRSLRQLYPCLRGPPSEVWRGFVASLLGILPRGAFMFARC